MFSVPGGGGWNELVYLHRVFFGEKRHQDSAGSMLAFWYHSILWGEKYTTSTSRWISVVCLSTAQKKARIGEQGSPFVFCGLRVFSPKKYTAPHWNLGWHKRQFSGSRICLPYCQTYSCQRWVYRPTISLDVLPSDPCNQYLPSARIPYQFLCGILNSSFWIEPQCSVLIFQ